MNLEQRCAAFKDQGLNCLCLIALLNSAGDYGSGYFCISTAVEIEDRLAKIDPDSLTHRVRVLVLDERIVVPRHLMDRWLDPEQLVAILASYADD